MCVCTFVLQVEAGVADGAVAAERQVHAVGAALDSLRQLAVLETTNQRAVAVRTVVDVQEVIVWLNDETRERERGEDGGRERGRDGGKLISMRDRGMEVGRYGGK